MFRHLVIPLVLGALFAPTLALADQISQFNEKNGEAAFTITDHTTYQSFNATTPVNLTFNQAGNQFGNVPQPGTMTWYATTSSTATGGGPNWTSTNLVGWFTVLDAASHNLFSGTFQDGMFFTVGQAAFFAATDGPPGVTFTSDYLDFTPSVSFTISLSMTLSSFETRNITDHFLDFDTAAMTGTFFADPPPVIGPEPTTPLLSGGALLGMGYLLRKRKKCRPLS